MKIKTYLLFLPALLGWISPTIVGAADVRSPNIVYVLMDDLGWGDIGYYGHPHLKTPNFDRLAESGVAFTQAYAPAPVCSPTRAGTLTGYFPAEINIFGHFSTVEENDARGMPQWLDPELPNFARNLQEAGYATAVFGKWHLGGPWQKNAPDPGAYGFDKYVTFVSNGPQLEEFTQPHGQGRHSLTNSSEAIADLSIDFINTHKDQPFLLYLPTHVAHSVLIPTEEMMAEYPQFVPFGADLNEPFRKVFGVDGFSTPMQVYYSMVTDMDRHLGRIFDHLEELGLADNTLIVVTSDNGPEVEVPLTYHSVAGSTGPFRGRKRSLYEGGVRVPFIARWPARMERTGFVDRETILSLVDMPATFAAAAGTSWQVGEGNDSQNMLSALLGQPQKREAPLFWVYRQRVLDHPINKSPTGAIREGRWKLLANLDGSRTELYDLETDLSEVDNKAAEHPELAERLRERLLGWMQAQDHAEKIQKHAGEIGSPWSRLRP